VPSPEELRRTVPAEAFGPAPGQAPAAAQEPPHAPGAGADDEPAFERTGIAEQLRRLGLPAPPTRGRFEIEGMLGAGGNGRVYSARDRDLERPVAIKLLAGSPDAAGDPIARFVEEARITAALEHPNVLPVHELEVNSHGQVFFTMKKIDGRSLGEPLWESTAGRRLPPLDDANAVVSLFIGVCQALALAHRRRIVHQDIKPENIMLGEFGEVLLVDWGSAVRLDQGEERRLYGTPLYMSPEQARRDGVDERSDVYCVGATLFHALVLRPPTWSEDLDRFWAMKRAGEIAPPTGAERAACPVPLLAIALKALAVRPEERYADAGALLDDLRRYQAGQAISAWREPWLSRARRWHRRNRRVLWSWTAAVAVVLALVAALWGQRLQEMASWGEPVTIERFSDDAWRTRWRPLIGSFAQREGGIVSTGRLANVLLYDHRLSGDIAVEYDAEMLDGPGRHPGDISLYWGTDLADNSELKHGFYRCQVGAFDGAYSSITGTIDGIDQHLAVSPFRPLPGHRYRVRVEIVGNRMTLAVDGHQLCEWIDQFPFGDGWIALYGMYTSKAFGDVRIYQRGFPVKVRATAIGDATARGGHYELAAAQYAMVGEHHEQEAIGREALYKRGLCEWLLGHDDDAERLWRPLESSEYAGLIRVRQVERRIHAGDLAGALGELEALSRSDDPEVRKLAAMRWSQGIEKARQSRDRRQMLLAYLDLHDRAFADQHAVDYSAATALIDLGDRQHVEQVLARYPYQRWLCTQALELLGRDIEVLRDYPEQRTPCSMAALGLGYYELIDPEILPVQHAMGLIQAGKPEQVLQQHPDDREAVASALIALGRMDEALAVPKLMETSSYQFVRALCMTGRAEEALSLSDHAQDWMALRALGRAQELLDRPGLSPPMVLWAKLQLTFEALQAGDLAEARRRLPEPLPVNATDPEILCVDFAMRSFFALHSGDWSLIDRRCDEAATNRYGDTQRLWHIGRFLSGREDEAAFRAQPYQAYVASNLLLLGALRHERLGERVAASAAYRAYLALPPCQRYELVDALRDRLVAWRAEQLSP
jgi:hypothetical protein